MRRILITGAAGFAGRHLQRELAGLLESEDVVLATSLGNDAVRETEGFPYKPMNILDEAAIERIFKDFAPTHVFHLAGISAPREALRTPDRAWQINVMGTILVASAAARHTPQGTFYFVSSAEVYGASFSAKTAVDENARVAPITLYARTKASAEQAVQDIIPRGQVVILRPFNHTGPGQDERFVVPAFASQIAQLEKKGAGKMLVGNLDAERDFLDVRDVAKAYALLIVQSRLLPNRSVLNIASSIPRRIRSILHDLLTRASCSISVEEDPARRREQEIPCVFGDAHLIRELVGWQPRIPWSDTLDAVLADQRSRVRSGY